MRPKRTAVLCVWNPRIWVLKLMTVIGKDRDKNTNSYFSIFNVRDNNSTINSVIKTNKKVG